MKRIIVISLFVFGLLAALPSPATAQQAPAQNFESTTKAYTAFFPVAPGEETSRTAKYLSKRDIRVHSYVSAEYKSEKLGHYIKYSISLEPLNKYKPYKDAISEDVDSLINFYDGQYEYRIPDLKDYDEDDSWGKDITIEFYDGKIAPEKRPENLKPWVIRRLVFYKDRHIFKLEALGSMEYMYAPATNKFFNGIKPSIRRVK